MPAYAKLAILALALIAIACAVTAQTVDTVLLHDTVVVYDTTVFQHTTYVLDSSTNYQKDLAELKGEFYDKALDALREHNTMIGWFLTLFGIVIAIFGGLSFFSSRLARDARKTIDKEVDSMRALRTKMEDVYESARKDAKEVKSLNAEMQAKVDSTADSASNVLSEAEEIDKQQPGLNLDKRLELIKDDDAAESAVEKYQELLNEMRAENLPLDRIPFKVHKDIGMAYYSLERWDESINALNLAHLMEPDDDTVLAMLGSAHGSADCMEKASRFYKRAVDKNPMNAWAWFGWGVALTDMFNTTKNQDLLEQCIEKYEMATRISPDYHEAYNNWGVACRYMYDTTKDKKWLERAFKKYERAIELKHDDYLSYNNWGVAFSSMFDATKDTKWLDLASKKYETAIKHKPDSHEVYNNWSGTCVMLYNATNLRDWLASAVDKSLRALEIAPEHKDYNFNLACAHALLGNKDDMIAALKEAIDYDGKHKEMARDDEDFKAYSEDEGFVALTKAEPGNAAGADEESD